MGLDFSLDPQLERATVAVTDLALSRVLLNDDANYPWLILVPRRFGKVELTDLDQEDRVALWREIALASRVLKSLTRCHKLNVAQLGNQVAQLHVHIIARETTDVAWPNPVWGKAPPKPYDATMREELVADLRRLIVGSAVTAGSSP